MKEAVYQGHGQIESYPLNSAMWGVIAHERRHANFNKYIADLKGEEVDQHVKISIQFEDGQPVPTEAHTDASFKKSKSKTEERFLKLLFLNFKISETEKKLASDNNSDSNNGESDKQKLFLTLDNLKKELQNLKQEIFKNSNVNSLFFKSKKEYAKFYGIFDFQKYNIPPAVIHNPVMAGYLVTEKLNEHFKKYETTESKKLTDVIRGQEAYTSHVASVWNSLNAKFLSFKDFLNNFNIDFFKSENSNEENFTVDSSNYNGNDETFSITIDQVAQSFIVFSKKFDDAYTPLNISGTVNINGVDITVKTSDSLYDIAQTINWGEDSNENGVLDYDEGEDVNDNEKLDGGTRQHGVYAYIEDNRLYLKNIETGDKSIVINDSDNIFHDFEIIKNNPVNDGIYFPNIAQEGKNAVYEINGKNFVSESNIINYKNMTIVLNKATSTEENFKVKKDEEDIYNSIVTFVNNYNYIMESLNKDLTDDNLYNTFTGNFIKRGMKIAAFSDVSTKDIINMGLELKENKEPVNEMEILLLKDGKNYNNSISKKLLSLGLKGNDDETISVDENKLKSVIKNNYTYIKEVFFSENGVIAKLKDFTDKITDENNGIISFEMNNLSSEDLREIKTYYNKEKIISDYLNNKLSDISEIVQSIK